MEQFDTLPVVLYPILEELVRLSNAPFEQATTRPPPAKLSMDSSPPQSL